MTNQNFPKTVLRAFILIYQGKPSHLEMVFPEHLTEYLDLSELKLAICKVFHVDRCETLEDYDKEVKAEQEYYRKVEEEAGL